MLFDPKYEEQLEVLEERLRHAHAFTPDLMSDVIAKSLYASCKHTVPLLWPAPLLWLE